MFVTVSKQDLVRCVSLAHQVADRRGSIPMLSNILLKTQPDGMLSVIASDLYVALTASVKADVKQEGAAAVPAKTLFNLVKNLPETAVQIKQAKHGTIELHCGRTHYKLPGLSGDEYPALPTIDPKALQEFEAARIAELVARTHYATSTDETRPHLSSALFECDGKHVRMVATDGHRLCKAEYDEENIKHPITTLIPVRGIAELRRLVDEAKKEKGQEKSKVGITAKDGHAFFSYGDVLLSVKLSDDQFLPYEKVIPQSHQRRVVAGRQDLLEALKRISVVSGERTGAVRLNVDNQVLTISCENAEVGEGKDVIDVESVGAPLTIGFNAKYLIDVLSSLAEDQIVLELNGEFDPGAIKPLARQDFIGVVMPMRI